VTPRRRKTSALVKNLLEWYSKNARDLPWRRTHDPYAVWVSEIMLQQTQVKTVIPFWERWQRELPTIAAAASAGSDQLHKLWEGLGYYTRVRNLQKAAQLIVTRHAGKFPERFDDILALPGIGRYTAGAIASIALNQPAPILDGNVIRVLTRLFGIAENPKAKPTNKRLWQLAEELVKTAQPHPSIRGSRRQQAPDSKSPGRPDGCSALNQSLMELGALVCTPRSPQCPVCPAKKLCVAFRENRVAELPHLGLRLKPTARHFVAFALEQDGKFLVRQRPAGRVNAHLWEFPNLEVEEGKADAEKLFKSEFGFAAQRFLPLLTVRHSITRYRITLEAFQVHLAAAKSPTTALSLRSSATDAETAAAWKTPAQMHELAFPSAHRKILRVLAARASCPCVSTA